MHQHRMDGNLILVRVKEKFSKTKPQRNANSNFIGLLHFIADPAIIVDAKGRFLVFKDTFMDLTGLNKNELTGKAFSDLKILNAENKALLLENLAKGCKAQRLIRMK